MYIEHYHCEKCNKSVGFTTTRLLSNIFRLVVVKRYEHILWFIWQNMGQISARVLCNIGYPYETHLRLKSRENSFIHDIRFRCPAILKLCTEYGNIIIVLCTKIQNDWITKKYVIGERGFTRFEFKIRFGRTPYIVQHLWEGLLQHKDQQKRNGHRWNYLHCYIVVTKRLLINMYKCIYQSGLMGRNASYSCAEMPVIFQSDTIIIL